MSRQIVFRSFLVLMIASTLAVAQNNAQLRFCLHSDPKTFNPLLAEEDSSETVRYLTGGVLMRLNRMTQDLEPELATSWNITEGGKTITFKLRSGLSFSDSTPFSADDVAFTIQQMMDPSLHSPTGDAFRSGDGKTVTKVLAPDRVSVTFPAAIAGLDKLFDQVAIMSAKSPRKEMAVLGPYQVLEYKAGNYLLLERNPHYWRQDAAGKQLPYIQSVRLDIQSNRDTEMLRLVRGEIDFINSLDAEYFDKLMQQNPALVHDSGVSLDSEQMWFNQVPNSPLPDYKKAWFRSTNFRRAISEAINREDLARVAFRGHARPAIGPMSPANKFWFNAKLQAHPFDQKSALARLAEDGFRFQDGVLRDRDGHAVEFSIITNAGNKYRERMATMMQQDLSGIGIKLNVVTLDFPSLIERITRSFDYEACLLGLIGNDLDPNSSQMNVWLSSGENHQWNPHQKSPATGWEAEIDKLMHQQATSLDPKKRKAAFDRVQEIAWEQEPFIYLVNRNALSAVSPNARNVHPVVLRPQVYWNIDEISISNEVARNR
ncbi:MAG TPA: ABC transporter substrate-binding protein [Terriglobales bacterium]|jgi:peptide/nickel transport system substrate-binding protein|nr:ABC transporter substrate-binding protein [Terriglobales bacterium]